MRLLLVFLVTLAADRRLEAFEGGSLIGWGANASGQARGSAALEGPGRVVIGGAALTNVVACAAGYAHGLALLANGTVRAWGSDHKGQATVPKGLTNIVAVAAGREFSVCLRANGTVVGWGDNEAGQLSVPPGVNNVKSIAAGMDWTFAVTRDGTVLVWGRADVLVPKGLTNVLAVTTAGGRRDRNLALLRNGGLFGWGKGSDVGAPVGVSNAIAIAVGDYHSLALLANGTVLGWGGNSSGQASGSPAGLRRLPYARLISFDGDLLKDVVAISAGQEYEILGTACRFSLALKRDGTLQLWGSGPQPPVGEMRIVGMAAGHNFCLAIQRQ